LEFKDSRLIILNGESSAALLDLEDGTLTVGRDEDNTIVIDDATVSPQLITKGRSPGA